jgi:hypothetical protein
MMTKSPISIVVSAILVWMMLFSTTVTQAFLMVQGPTHKIIRCCNVVLQATAAPPAKSKEEDIELTRKVIRAFCEKAESTATTNTEQETTKEEPEKATSKTEA